MKRHDKVDIRDFFCKIIKLTNLQVQSFATNIFFKTLIMVFNIFRAGDNYRFQAEVFKRILFLNKINTGAILI